MRQGGVDRVLEYLGVRKSRCFMFDDHKSEKNEADSHENGLVRRAIEWETGSRTHHVDSRAKTQVIAFGEGASANKRKGDEGCRADRPADDARGRSRERCVDEVDAECVFRTLVFSGRR